MFICLLFCLKETLLQILSGNGKFSQFKSLLEVEV